MDQPMYTLINSSAQYRMTTLESGTRIRDTHNTAGKVLTSVWANVTVEGTEKFVASAALSNSGGVYQAVGDIWLRVTYNGVTGWMAYTHMGKPICKDFQDLTITPEPPPDPATETYTATLVDDKTGDVWAGTLIKQP